MISVFISSSFLVNNAHAQTTSTTTGTVTLVPDYGSCNPFANTLANSERFLTASSYDDLSGTPGSSQLLASDYGVSGSYVQGSGQLVREAAVYANGNEPMAVTIAYASETAALGEVYGRASADLENWPFLVFSKATGTPLAKNPESIPVDLSYIFSMTTPTPTGTDGSPAFGGGAFALGRITFGDTVTGVAASFDQGAGDYAYENSESTSSPQGTLSITYSVNAGPLMLGIDVTAFASASVDPQVGNNWPLAEAQAVADPYAYIDPSSPLAAQLQVYVGTTANANPSIPSEWTPSVQTPIDLSKIVPLATPLANSTVSPSTSSTPTVTLTPTASASSTPLATSTVANASPASLPFPIAIIAGVGVVVVVVAVVAVLVLLRTRKKSLQTAPTPPPV